MSVLLPDTPYEPVGGDVEDKRDYEKEQANKEKALKRVALTLDLVGPASKGSHGSSHGQAPLKWRVGITSAIGGTRPSSRRWPEQWPR
jgi:hypothetical protein